MRLPPLLFFPKFKDYTASIGEVLILAGIAQIICIFAGSNIMCDWSLYKVALGGIIGTLIGHGFGNTLKYMFDLETE